MAKNARTAEAGVDVTEEMHAETEGEVNELAAGAMFEDNEDGLVVNLAGVEAMKFDNLPPMTVHAIVEENVYSLSKSSGKPMWSLKMSITEGEFKNRKLFPILSWSEKAIPGTKAVLQVLEPDLAEAQFRVNDPDVVVRLVGKIAKVRVGIQKGQNGYDDRNRITKWMMPDASQAFLE